MFRLWLGVLLWVLVSPQQPCTARHQTYVYPPDAAILLQLNAEWEQPFDNKIGSWSASNPCADWFGVDCDGTGRAVSLALSGEVVDLMLSGSIPSAIANLTALTLLDLSENELSGPLPSTIGSMTQLKLLDLSRNQLSGPLPSTISSLKQLLNLDLSGNQLSGPLLSTIGSLTQLETLELSGNQLSGSIPSTIGSFTRLYGLYLQENQLSGSLPFSIFSLTQLSFLDLSSNQLSGSLPSSFGKMVSLTTLSLQHNKLTGPLPPLVAGLNGADISYNFLSGTCPSRSLDPTTYGNCFQNCSARDTKNLRSKAECSSACGSDQASGPCGGKGACFVNGPTKPATCVCKRGFLIPAPRPGTCVPPPSPRSPPPRPPPRSPPPAPHPPPGSVTKLCAGAVRDAKKCKCPPRALCERKASCNKKYVCRCVGKRRPKTDPKTGILKACV